MIPLIILAILICGLIKKTDIISTFCEGAKENLLLALELCPTLILLMTAVSMFTESGAADMISRLVQPVFEVLGFPKECSSLMLVRPVSGSASLSVLDKLLAELSPNSFPARTASVMMGATETTLYTIAVYYSAVGKKPDWRIFASSFAADIAGFIFAPLAVRLFY